MMIKVRYFAQLRERLGRAADDIAWEEAAPTVGGLRELLARREPASAGVLRTGALLVAVNREYAAADAVLHDGDEVALFPPVTGG